MSFNRGRGGGGLRPPRGSGGKSPYNDGLPDCNSLSQSGYIGSLSEAKVDNAMRDLYYFLPNELRGYVTSLALQSRDAENAYSEIQAYLREKSEDIWLLRLKSIYCFYHSSR